MHYTVNWFCTFLQTHYLPLPPLLLFLFVWSWNLCHEIAREFISFVLWVSVSNFIYATFLPPRPFLFCLREIFASLFYLLTLYNIVFTCFCLVYDLLFVLTKPNWTFLLYYSCFFLFCHQVRRLLLLSCFPFSLCSAPCALLTSRFICVRACVYWWARLLWWTRACLHVCEWGC